MGLRGRRGRGRRRGGIWVEDGEEERGEVEVVGGRRQGRGK